MNAENQLTVRKRLHISHRRQFEGEDFQKVAIELTEDIFPDEEREEAFNELSSSPDPGCDCGFCRNADWADEPQLRYFDEDTH